MGSMSAKQEVTAETFAASVVERAREVDLTISSHRVFDAGKKVGFTLQGKHRRYAEALGVGEAPDAMLESFRLFLAHRDVPISIK